MAFPNQSLDQNQLVNQVTSGQRAGPQSGPWSGSQGYASNMPPSPSGLSTREGQVPPYRDARTTRQVMKWLVPEQPLIEMYVNPSRVNYKHSKLINKSRTKGGYSLQYWGENLSSLEISGTTGTSGIEGINVLMDIYRNEQLMFEPYALTLAAERDKAEQDSFDSLLFGGAINDVKNIVTDLKSAQRGYYNSLTQSRNKPTLASLAFTVELYWSNEIWRGFFENFSITEAAEHFGLFDYSFTFTVTQKRGFRENFQAWHKSPTYGQSQSDNHKPSPPYSYGVLVGSQPISNNIQNSASIIDAFQVY